MSTERSTGPQRPPKDDGPVLPVVTEDEQDRGWGDDRDSGRRGDDWYHRERPPHHGD
jgi:hypothetical protein